jgi:APA family basic amino acid/polyamine antiporter
MGGRPGPGLQRRLGLFSATSLVVANMIGTGIFTTSGFILERLGDPWSLLWCWLAGGLLALAGALCYGELGANLPRTGGEYVFLRRSLGPAVAFVSGWISLIVGFSAPIAASAIALAAYLLPALGLESGWQWQLEVGGRAWLRLTPQAGLALGAIGGLSLVHWAGLVLGARVQNCLTVLKLAILGVFLAAGFVWGRGSWEHLAADPASATLLSGDFAVALVFVMFAYSGWNAAAYLGGEIKDPARNIPRALALGAGLVTLLYLAINLLYLYALPPERMSGVLELGSAAARALFGPAAGAWFGLAIAGGLLSVLSAMIVAGPRVYYAMAADGLFFASLARVNRRGTPGAAIAWQAAIAGAMVLTASFDALLIYIGFTLSLFAALTVAGLMVLRRRGELAAGYRTPGYPLTPAVFILASLWIVAHSLATSPLAPVWGLATMAAGAGVYGWFRRRGRAQS